ncbi:MAG: hypothetical protein NC826_04320, partial [Candidatus Omnitrophica bacterium]|nr:hypothetical protein [Candidatus Omnitrophota bacterium]
MIIGIYIITILISIIIGATILYISGLRTSLTKNKDTKNLSSTFKPQFKEPWEYVLFEEVNTVVGLPEKSQQIVQQLIEVVNREIERKMSSVEDELKYRYESIV